MAFSCKASDVEPSSRDVTDMLEDFDHMVGNQHDLADMHRLGKKQEFKRTFNFLSTLSFICIHMATWEFVLVSLALGPWNGGFAGLFWTCIGTIICYSSVAISLADGKHGTNCGRAIPLD